MHKYVPYELMQITLDQNCITRLFPLKLNEYKQIKIVDPTLIIWIYRFITSKYFFSKSTAWFNDDKEGLE